MKICGLLMIWILVWPIATKSQIITTIAGNGNGGDNTPAITAHIFDPNGIVIDKIGNIYFATNIDYRVRKIDTAGIISTIAGTGNPGFTGDNGAANLAMLNQPVDIALDSVGNLFIADAANNRIRKIDISTGVITTVVGNGTAAFAGDGGQAINASLKQPSCICFDKSGNMYIADNANYRIRKVNTSGIISTIAGNGLHGCTGDGGPAINAKCTPEYIRIDNSGNIYVAEWDQYRIRKIDASGIISTIAGDSLSYIYNGDNVIASQANMSPAYIDLDPDGALYISDYSNDRIRKIGFDGIIHTVVGNGVGGYSGDGGFAKDAEINSPSGLAFDRCGNLYFGQVDNAHIRKVTFHPNCFPESVNEVAGIDEVSIYPNPAKEQLTVAASSGLDEVLVLNAVGQTLIAQKNYKSNNAIVNVSGLAAGVYFVKMSDSKGAVVTKRFVKE